MWTQLNLLSFRIIKVHNSKWNQENCKIHNKCTWIFNFIFIVILISILLQFFIWIFYSQSIEFVSSTMTTKSGFRLLCTRDTISKVLEAFTFFIRKMLTLFFEQSIVSEFFVAFLADSKSASFKQKIKVNLLLWKKSDFSTIIFKVPMETELTQYLHSAIPNVLADCSRILCDLTLQADCINNSNLISICFLSAVRKHCPTLMAPIAVKLERIEGTARFDTNRNGTMILPR